MPRHASFSVRLPVLIVSLCLLLMGLPAVPNHFLNLILPVARAATTFTVNSTGDGADSNLADGVCNDGTGACTLRAAIQQANAAGGDSINFSLTTGSAIVLMGGELVIDKGLSISGPGAQLLTVSGNNASRVFRVTSVTSVVISGLTISGGRAVGAGGIFNDGGTLNINSCSISNNNATTGVGGGISNGTGAQQAGVLNINNSTISNNAAGNGGGGLFQIAGAVLTNTTISNNSTGGSGGGINNANPATLINVTISGNTASGTGGGIYNPGIGTLTFKNTLIAGNTSPSGPDCFGANFVSQDYNLIGNTVGAQIVGTTTHNITNVDPLLGPLASNGGPTLTHALLGGSQAVDGGSNANLPSDTFDLDGDGNTSESTPFDQRGTGFNRTEDGNGDGSSTVDIGAYEVHSILVTNTADSGPGSLRQAITDANNTAVTDAINFQIGLMGAITLSSALPDFSTSIAINGPGASLLTVQRSAASGTADFRIFTISSGSTVAISGLTISNGNVVGPGSPADSGGGILNAGTLTVSDSTLSGNSAAIRGVGGGIHNFDTLTVNHSIVSGNNGGGIANTLFGANTTTIINTSVISGNTGGSGVYNNGFNGVATLTINNSTISNNSAPSPGGGGILNGSGSFNSRAILTISGSTISGNNASNGRGGGIYSAAFLGNAVTSLTMTNTTISGNSCSDHGGGIAHFGSSGGVASATVISSTISANSAGSGEGGGIYTDVGVETINPLTLHNTITAGNFRNGMVSSDISGTVNPASSFNLVGTGGSGELTNGVNNNQVGVASPGLAPLVDNGGTTLTHALLSSSPALDKGSNTQSANAGLTTDQRGTGFSRIVDGLDADSTATVDIGAFEAQVSVEELTDKTVNEDSQLQFSFMVAGSVTSVSAASSNTTLVPSNPANIAVTGSGSTRTLTINPAANQFGTATITVTVNGNNSQSITETFLLTVNPVNDAPSFARGPNQTVNNSAGLQTVVNWATNILPGPSNESGQTLSFSVVGNTNPALFAAAPAISNTGVLTYAPATNAGGTATVSIVVQDNGGTASGGQDMSPAQSFSITVIPVGGFLKFESSNFSTTESSGFTTITVLRVGDLTRAVTVNYATSADSGTPCSTATGVASSKCDFTSALGTLNFAAAESAKTFIVLISQDSYVEGTETLTLSLSDPAGGSALDAPSTATLTITDDATEPATNPNDVADSFVRQHYHDFLNREPDAIGLAFWSDQITSCGTDTTCVELRRINVSAAFFLSIEFQQTGYLVYRMYKAAYDDLPNAPVPVRLNEFLPDTQEIGRGVVVGQVAWEVVLENNKRAFAANFVGRPRFTIAHPTTLTPEQFVDALFANAGVTPSTTDRQAAIDEFGGAGNTADVAARARVLRLVAENSMLAQQEFNRAFVLMQYFGYLRRNPNDAPEPGLNFDGYNFWLGKLNQFNGNFINAEMVKAFILSSEYRQRFGP